MRRFQWTLQRLLDVTRQRETVLLGELEMLASRVASLQAEIVQRRVRLRGVLRDLGQLTASERLPRQAMFLSLAQADEREIRTLEGRCRELADRRKDKQALYVQTRRRREGLERLRGEALDRHRREMDREEQKQLDEAGCLQFARRPAR